MSNSTCSEGFYDDGTNSSTKLVCSSSNDGGLTWSRPRVMPPFYALQTLVEPSRPSVTFWGGGRSLLAFIGNFGQPSARVVLTDAGLEDLAGDCRFRAPVVNLYEQDEVQSRALRRVKVVANQATGPILAVEYKSPVPDAVGPENNARCRIDLVQLVFVPSPAPGGYRPRTIFSYAAPCRRTIPASPAALDLSHFDLAVDEAVRIVVPNVDTSTTATNIHLVTVNDPTSDDVLDGSEVVYHRVATNGTGDSQTHVREAPFIVSNASRDNELVFQPTVSAVALPFQPTRASTDVFVTWYQMNANGQVRLLGRRRNAADGQWGAVQTLHSVSPDRAESLCPTARAGDPIWSRYGGSVAMIDGWPARGSISDPNVRFDAFPLAVTLFTSSRTRGCSDQSDNSALYQELHAARWR